MTDRELLTRYARGDLPALEALVDRHEGPLLRYAARLSAGSRGAREQAQDIVQEVFLRLVREAARLEAVENVSAWLYRVARNVAIDLSRKEERMERRLETAARPEAEEDGPSPEEEREVGCVVREKLLGLPERQRDVLILKIQEGKSYREISAITGLTPSNIGYLIHTGLKSLADQLRLAGVV